MPGVLNYSCCLTGTESMVTMFDELDSKSFWVELTTKAASEEAIAAAMKMASHE